MSVDGAAPDVGEGAYRRHPPPPPPTHNGSRANQDSSMCSHKAHSSFRMDENDGLLRDQDNVPPPSHHSTTTAASTHSNSTAQTIAGVAGNILEWYDFAVFGFLSDIIGDVFFPPQQGNSATVKSFAVFGGAFLMRPIGGVMMGYIGDVYGRKRALVLSIFLMAFPTFAMGCLPTYEQVGAFAIVLLVIVRLLQGLSVGGQLMSSLVFTLETHETTQWGLYGSFVMAGANLGTLLGGLAGYALRSFLSYEQLVAWGWRLPFWSGILVSFSGFYLRSYENVEDDQNSRHCVASTRAAAPSGTNTIRDSQNSPDVGADHNTPLPVVKSSDDCEPIIPVISPPNPLRIAFAAQNRRSLLAAALVPMLWSSGFYLSFVWMAIFMEDLIESPVPHAFGVNSAALLISVCLFFPVAGILSDRYGRRFVMTIGGVSVGVLSPILVLVIGKGNALNALVAQSSLGVALSFWGAPMCAWLVEAFEPEARLTSVAIGYNLAQATVGGLTPSVATIMVDSVGVNSPGWILTVLSILSLTGLWIVAPPVGASPPASSTRKRTFQALPSTGECEMVVTQTSEDDTSDPGELI